MSNILKEYRESVFGTPEKGFSFNHFQFRKKRKCNNISKNTLTLSRHRDNMYRAEMKKKLQEQLKLKEMEKVPESGVVNGISSSSTSNTGPR